jgi:hypothetical protein
MAANKAEENGQDMYQSLEDLVGQSISLKEVERALPVYAPDEEYDEAEIYGAIKQMLQVRAFFSFVSNHKAAVAMEQDVVS